MTSFWKEQSAEKLFESSNRPPLPFNIGQLGLVLTSGCLDGVVDEGNGYKHIVKGRVARTTNQERTQQESTVTVEETVGNKVEINVLLPDGTHKVLA